MVSDIPGNREWITEGEQGWLTPVGDERALADAIQRALGNSDLKAMGQRARASAEARADWQQSQAGIFQAYEIARERLNA